MSDPGNEQAKKPGITRTKRVRADNAQGANAAHEAALLGPPRVPDHIKLRPCDQPFWDAIVRARARDEWGRVELVLAAQLAGVQADMENMKQLAQSGDRAAMEEAGFPSIRAIRMTNGALLAQQISLMRALRMIGTVVGDPDDEVPRRRAEREAERTIKSLQEAGKPENEEEPPLLAL